VKRIAIALALAAAGWGTAHAQDLPAGDAAHGEAVFRQCMACHRIGPGAADAVGPVLNGVVGRPAASIEGYNYSNAMRESGLTWDEANLAAYLRSPSEKVPGGKMPFLGIKDDQNLSDVIAYLKQFDAEGNQAAQ
jgi:cytochrome c